MMDDPAVPEFATYDSYNVFARRVRRQRRYATDTASRAFIATVLATAPPRDLGITAGTIFSRAQLEIDEIESVDEDEGHRIEILGLGKERMIPRPELVQAGRANPPGIAFLYLASCEETAISEVRPWIGAGVSVAQFRIKRDLRALDLTKGHGEFGFAKLNIGQLMGEKPVDAALKRKTVWTDIDSAFSRPASRAEEAVDYVPTQILAEAFRDVGYEAIVYRSNFGDPGYNIVLFDVGDAEILNCSPFTVKKLKVEAEQCGNTWFVAKKQDEITAAK